MTCIDFLAPGERTSTVLSLDSSGLADCHSKQVVPNFGSHQKTGDGGGGAMFLDSHAGGAADGGEDHQVMLDMVDNDDKDHSGQVGHHLYGAQ